jgi:hypothetical protein
MSGEACGFLNATRFNLNLGARFGALVVDCHLRSNGSPLGQDVDDAVFGRDTPQRWRIFTSAGPDTEYVTDHFEGDR